ncbi:MAG: ABC transporter substrate-binding protein [Anaerovoracaceae bacterium]|jgi:peptide/nickel transport system substrate-binding protein
MATIEDIRKKLEEFRWTKKTVTIAVLIVAVIIAAIVTAVVVSSRSDKDVVTEGGVTYKNSSHLYLAMNNVKTFNPIISKDQDTYYISKLVYEGLFELDKDMVPQPVLAKDYTIDRRSNKITIDLENADFQNGETLTSSDVKYTIEAMKAAGTGAYSESAADISYVETAGKQRVKIYFNEGGRMTLSDLTFPILPRGQYGGVYDVIYRDDFKPVGTGPYRCTKYSRNSGVNLKPFDNYHGRDKAENTISFTVMSKSADKYRMTEDSNISLNFTKSLTREAKVTQEDTKLIDFPANEVECLGFNFTHEEMADKNVRKAIASAINNQAIIQECYYNCGMTNDNIYYPNYMGIDSSKDQYKYSRARAKKYLRKAGYKDRDHDGYVENSDMGELSLTLLTTSDQIRQKMAEMVQKNLENAGIHVSLSYAETKNYETYLKSGNFDIFIAGLEFSENNDMSQFLRGTEMTVKYTYDNSDSGSSESTESGTEENSGKYNSSDESGTGSGSSSGSLKEEKSYSNTITGQNYTRYYSKKVNSLLDSMDSGLSNEKMKTRFSSLKKKLTDDLPYYCLLYKTYGVERSPAIRGTVKPEFWNIYNGCKSWKARYEIESEEQ